MPEQIPTVVAGTDPYPWPWDGDLRPARFALVVCGVQRVHADASPRAEVVLAAIAELSSAVRPVGGLVCHVRHTASGRSRPLLPERGNDGWAPVLGPGPDDLLVAAAGHDGFFGGPLDTELRIRGRDQLAVVGLAAEVTVSSTVRSANDRGYECLTVADATAPLSPSTGHHELHSVTMSGGIFGAVGRARDLVAALAAAPGVGTTPVPVPPDREDHP